MTSRNEIIVWNASDQVSIPQHVNAPGEIVEYAAPSLSKRDRSAIISGFEAGSYEMVSTFVWAKAAAALKKQVATLGMEFVGEMLGRPDLDDDSDPATSLADHEAIALAEDLGMITPTQGIRLKHALELVSHFAKLDQPDREDEYMQVEEAVGLLRTCVTSILGKPKFDAAIKFAEFRRALGERQLRSDDGDVAAIKDAPYFFIRTTLSVLLSTVKNARSATLEHAVGNTILLVPILWERLREPEKWQIGQAYAEVNAAGNRISAAGLKKALIEVHGFDFVPENLRSSTFTEAAARVLSAHFGFNNFFTEAEPMCTLANLGTAIPRPAFAKCMEATLAVKLGNLYGYAWAAEDDADKVLKSLRTEQWEYYLNECLTRDRTILDKLAEDDKPTLRWFALVAAYKLSERRVSDRLIKELLEISSATDIGALKRLQAKAGTIRKKVGQ